MGKIRDRRDLTGMQFGHWTVLCQNPERRYSHIYYDCRCACGVRRTVGAMHLRSGKSTNCGITPAYVEGPPTVENGALLCGLCHKLKTVTDNKEAKKSNRLKGNSQADKRNRAKANGTHRKWPSKQITSRGFRT